MERVSWCGRKEGGGGMERGRGEERREERGCEGRGREEVEGVEWGGGRIVA